MGVYIDMEMPKDGETVTITICADGLVFEEFKEPGSVFHAVPVQPHGRLGDMDAIARKIRRFGDYVDFTKDEIAGWFENGDFETIIPAEKVES